MTPVTWSELAMLEPALAELEAEVRARAAAAREEPQFCRVDEFYDRVKPRLFKLVGWHREEPSLLHRPMAGALLSSSAAYEAVYDHLLALLPPCRGSGCVCEGRRAVLPAATGEKGARSRPRWSATDDPQVEVLMDDLLGTQGLHSSGRGSQAIANNWEELDRRVERARSWWSLAEAGLLAGEDHHARRGLLEAGDFAITALQDTVAAMRETITRVAAVDAVTSGPPELRELCLECGREDLWWFMEEFEAAAADASPLADPDAFRSALQKRLAARP